MNTWKYVAGTLLMTAVLSVTAWAMLSQRETGPTLAAAGQAGDAKPRPAADPLEPGPDYSPDP